MIRVFPFLLNFFPRLNVPSCNQSVPQVILLPSSVKNYWFAKGVSTIPESWHKQSSWSANIPASVLGWEIHMNVSITFEQLNKLAAYPFFKHNLRFFEHFINILHVLVIMLFSRSNYSKWMLNFLSWRLNISCCRNLLSGRFYIIAEKARLGSTHESSSEF